MPDPIRISVLGKPSGSFCYPSHLDNGRIVVLIGDSVSEDICQALENALALEKYLVLRSK